MNCPDCDIELQTWLDGTADLPPPLTEHLANCARCRDLHHAARLLRGGLPNLAWPTPPLGLSRRIVARVRAERQGRHIWRTRLVGVAAAAALLLMLLPLASRWLPTAPPTPEPKHEQARQTAPIPEEVPPKPGPSLKTTVDEARQAMLNLGGRLADETQKQAQLLLSAAPKELPPMTAFPGMTEPDTTPDPARQSLVEVSTNVTTGLQSVTNSARHAVDYFGRELPSFGQKGKN